MTQTQFEKNSIELAYSAGVVSYEEYCKLMDDITPLLWDEIMAEVRGYDYEF